MKLEKIVPIEIRAPWEELAGKGVTKMHFDDVLDATMYSALTIKAWAQDELREQLIYMSWRGRFLGGDLLPYKLAEFKYNAPTDYPSAWDAWVVHRATHKMLGGK